MENVNVYITRPKWTRFLEIGLSLLRSKIVKSCIKIPSYFLKDLTEDSILLMHPVEIFKWHFSKRKSPLNNTNIQNLKLMRLPFVLLYLMSNEKQF